MITERERALWDLLDQIDTGFDVFKPQMEHFEEFVQQKVQKRFGILTSDGHELFEIE